MSFSFAKNHALRRSWRGLFSQRLPHLQSTSVVHGMLEVETTMKGEESCPGGEGDSNQRVAEVAQLVNIPKEIALNIMDLLEPRDLKSVRLVSGILKDLSTPILFRNIIFKIDIPESFIYCRKHEWCPPNTGRQPCHGKHNFTHRKSCPFFEYPAAKGISSNPTLSRQRSLKPLLEPLERDLRNILHDVLPYAENVTINVHMETFRRKFGSFIWTKEKENMKELMESFTHVVMPLLKSHGHNIKTLRLHGRTLPTEDLQWLFGVISDFCKEKKLEFHFKFVIDNTNWFSESWKALEDLASLEIVVVKEYIPDTSNLPTWESIHDIRRIRCRLAENVTSLLQRCPKLEIPDDLGETIEAKRYFEVVSIIGAKQPLFIGSKDG